MKKLLHLFICILNILWLANWGTQQTTIDGNNKQRVNFYGTLYTYQGSKPLEIDNISVGFKYRQIPVYEKPAQHAQAIPVSGSGTFTIKEIKLAEEPRLSLVTTKIDLNEVAEIRVPHPYTMWTYQKQKGYRKTEYIEIEVISKNEKRTKAHYLLERKIKVYCDGINSAGPVEKEVPLPAIKKLEIKGYKLRNMTQKEKECPVCPTPPTKQSKELITQKVPVGA